MCTSCSREDLPTYQSKATPEQREENQEFADHQMRTVLEQEAFGTPSSNIKIRCGCLTMLKWHEMFRCLYCKIYFCKECAEFHFGAKVPE